MATVSGRLVIGKDAGRASAEAACQNLIKSPAVNATLFCRLPFTLTL